MHVLLILQKEQIATAFFHGAPKAKKNWIFKTPTQGKERRPLITFKNLGESRANLGEGGMRKGCLLGEKGVKMG